LEQIFNRRKLGRFRGRVAGPRRLLTRWPSDPPSSRRGTFDCGLVRILSPVKLCTTRTRHEPACSSGSPSTAPPLCLQRLPPLPARLPEMLPSADRTFGPWTHPSACGNGKLIRHRPPSCAQGLAPPSALPDFGCKHPPDNSLPRLFLVDESLSHLFVVDESLSALQRRCPILNP
jgi:hypothetical protein